MFRLLSTFCLLFLSICSFAQQVKIVQSGRACAADRTCGGDSTTFKPTLTPAGQVVRSYSWNFGDTQSGKANTSANEVGRHLYGQRGSYKVSLTVTLTNGQILRDSLTAIINPLPSTPSFFGGKSDTTICESERGKLFLNPYESPLIPAPKTAKYSWYPYGDTTQVIKVDSSGCYSVTVTDSLTGCPVSAKIDVKICAEQLPPPKQKWFFGNEAGIEFMGGSDPTAITTGKTQTKEGVSTYTDKKGKLQFYTDGVVIYDREGKRMKVRNPPNPADTLLAGNRASTQSSIIIQQPGCNSCEYIYYVFTTQEINDSTRILSYSVIDMRLNKGKGEVIELNVPLYGPTTERLTAVKNPKDSSYYIVTHDYKTNIFRSFNLNKQGIAPARTTPIGAVQNTPAAGEGQMKIAPSGTKIGSLIPGGDKNILEIYDYVDTTGVISNRVAIDLGPAPPKAYGLEFSPDGRRVFVTLQGDSAKKIPSQLLTFDLTTKDSTAIAQSKITLDSTATEIYGSLQYAPNGKIYVARQGKTSLGVINVPTGNTKRLIDYQANGVSLGGRVGQLGLPSLVQNEIDQSSGPGISVSDTCANDVTNFQAGPWCETRNETYRWNFDYKGPNIDQLPKLPGIQFPYARIIAGLGNFTGASKETQTTHKYPGPGNYRVALYIKNDCKDTLIIQPLTIKPAPTADLGKDRDTCANSLVLDSKDRSRFSEYYWFRNGRPIATANATGPSLRVTESGTYVVLVYIDECFAFDSVEVNLRKPMPLDLGRPQQTICAGNTLTLDAGQGFKSYRWSNGAVTQRNPVNTAGTYIVNVIDRNDCPNADTVMVAVRPKPTWKAEVQPTQSCTDATGSIKITDIQPADTYTFAWFKDGQALGNNSSEIRQLNIGNYRVLIKGTVSCDTVALFTVNAVTPNIRVQAVSGNPAYCDDLFTGQIRIAIFNTGTKPTQYTLRDATTGVVVRSGTYASIKAPDAGDWMGLITNLPVGTYALELEDATGCKVVRNDLKIGILPASLLDRLTNPSPFCQGDSVRLDAGDQADTFLWSTGAKTRSIIVKTAGTYRVIATNSRNQCQSVADVLVRVNPTPIVNAGAGQTLCGNAIPLSLTGATPAGGTWTGNGVLNGVFTPSVSSVGTKVLTYTVSVLGCEGKGTRQMLVLASPPAELLPPNEAWCEDAPQRITAPEVPNGNYRWSSGEITRDIQPTGSGRYILTITLGSCRSVDTVNVRISAVPQFFNIKANPIICVAENGSTTLDPGNLTGWIYAWQPNGETTRRITVSQAGAYAVKVTNTEGCSAQQPFLVDDRCEPRIYIPDIFTPNGDGENDQMAVYVEHLTDFDLKIFNRWGEVVFATNDPNDRWDGRYHGTLYPTQSYAWAVSYKSLYYPSRPPATKRGAVIVAK